MRIGSMALSTRLSAALRVALAGVVVLAVAGCLKADADLTVSSDNTVDGTLIVAVDESLLEITGQSEEEFLDQFLQGAGPLGQQAPESGSIEQERYSEEGKLGARYRLSDIPLAEFNEGEGQDSVRIVRDGDKFRVSGVLDLSNPGDLTGTPFGEQAQDLLRDAEIRVKLTFPGDVESATGAVDGNSVTWAPEFGERVETIAVADAEAGLFGRLGGGLGTALLVGAVLALLLVVGIVGLLLIRRRDRPATANAGAAPGFGVDDRFAPYTGPPASAEPFAPPPGGGSGLADTAPLPGAAQPSYPPPPAPPPPTPPPAAPPPESR